MMKSLFKRLVAGCARFWPHPLNASKREIILSGLGAGIGLIAASALSHWWLGQVNLWFIAPMGASAVLLFAVPNSPLAQPWSIIGGNLIAATLGVTFSHLVPEPVLASGLAVSSSIILMFLLRCLHPPSGAVALTAVLGGDTIYHLGYQFVLSPVMLNSLVMVILALVINALAGRRYPHVPAPAKNPAEPVLHDVSFTRADLHEALSGGTLFDIDEDDLSDILHKAEQIALNRRQSGVGQPAAAQGR